MPIKFPRSAHASERPSNAGGVHRAVRGLSLHKPRSGFSARPGDYSGTIRCKWRLTASQAPSRPSRGLPSKMATKVPEVISESSKRDA